MNKTSLIFAAAASAVILTACSRAEPKKAIMENPSTPVSAAQTAPAGPAEHTAEFISNERAKIGKVVLTRTAKGVSALVKIEGLTPGKHGMHFHEKGDCSDDAFKNSGGHINPKGHQHGLKNPDGPDNADLPNLVVDADGTASQRVMNGRISFSGEGGRPALFDKDGSAMIIHANPDDQVTQPIGGAGARVACAVIKR